MDSSHKYLLKEFQQLGPATATIVIPARDSTLGTICWVNGVKIGQGRFLGTDLLCSSLWMFHLQMLPKICCLQK